MFFFVTMVLLLTSDRGRSRGDTPPEHKMSDQSEDEFDTGQPVSIPRAPVKLLESLQPGVYLILI